MLRVMVNVRRAGDPSGRDLEVPAEVESIRLAEMIAHAMAWQSDEAGEPLCYRIRADSLKRVLGPDESLLDAGVWDGSGLVLLSEKGAPGVVQRGKAAPSLDQADLDDLARKAQTLERLGRRREAVEIYQQIAAMTTDPQRRTEWEGALRRLGGERESRPLSERCLATLTTQSGRVFRITKTRVRIGRNTRSIINDIDLGSEESSKSVHRRHLRLEYRDGEWYLQLESGAKNPTSVRGQPIGQDEPVLLHDGDEIRAAGVRMTFRIQGESQQ